MTFALVRRAAAILLVLACLPLPSAPATAQQAETTAPASNHERLYDAINGGLDRNLLLENQIRGISRQMVESMPEVQEVEEFLPGVTHEMMQRLRPVIVDYLARIQQDYRPRMIAAIAMVFTPAEAGELADFYASPIGRRVLAVASNNLDAARTTQAQLEGHEVTAQMIEADRQQMVRESTAALTPAEQARIEQALSRIPAARRLPEMARNMMPLQLAMNNEPLSTAEERAIVRIVEALITEWTKDAGKAD